MAHPLIFSSLLSAQFNSDTTQRFPGLQERCREFSGQPLTFTDQVLDDMDGEQETLAIQTDSDAIDEDIGGEVFLDEQESSKDVASRSEPDSALSIGLTRIDSTGLRSALKDASKGLSEGTHAQYQRLMNQCERFLIDRGLIKECGDFFTTKPPRDAAEMIVTWIMDACDSKKLDGTDKSPNEVRKGYSHAQKMRAAATFGFGCILGKGRTPWAVSETGEMVGNPSVSEMVSCYMVNLRRCKVQAGDLPTSSRAITPEIIGKLWNFNHREENWVIKKYSPGRRDQKPSDTWGGPLFRRGLHLGYTLAYVCLLSVDEVLNIQSQDIEIADLDTLKVTLPFRRTGQFGHIQPFFLKKLPEEMKQLCPVRAYAEWIAETKITEGFTLRKMDSRDRFAADSTKHMSSNQFLAGFRNNLSDIGVDPSPYGTHSFQRGGCQWLSTDLRWPIHKICEWGGWSVDFSYMTIAKYLISSTDDLCYPRESFFDMNIPVACRLCGRICECS